MFLSWDEDDQDAALAFMREQAKVCPSCGTRDEEWADGDPYEVASSRCRGCELLEGAHESMADKPGSRRGLRLYLRRADDE